MVTDELVTLVEEALDDILRMSYHNAQSRICSVVYGVLRHVMLHLLRKNVIGETVHAYVSKVFAPDAAADKFLKHLQTSSSFMAPTATFAQRKTHTSIVNKNTLFAKASKIEPVVAMEVNGNIIEELPSQPYAGSE